jgi:small-conductance mechanosensitive channel
MDTAVDTLPQSVDQLFTASSLSQLAALAIAVAAGALVGRVLSRRAAATGRAGASMSDALAVIAPAVAGLLLIAIVRVLFTVTGAGTGILDRGIELALALVAIRSLVYLVAAAFGSANRYREWENRATLILWLLVALHLLGWLKAMVAFLDSMGVVLSIRGTQPITVWSLIRSLVTVVVFVLIGAWFGRWVERRVATMHALAAGTRVAVAKFAYASLIGLAILIGLSVSGFNLSALSFFGGALGLGLGFGLQAIAANFVSGFVLLMDKSIKPGDVISFTGTLGTSTEGFGWVQELRGRYVVVRDRDGVETLVPNQNLITNQVINWSYSDRRVRLKLPVRISYEDNPETAMEVLLKAAEGHHRILREPAPVARLMSFHDYGMDLELRFWIADPEGGVNNVRSDVNRAIWRLFKEQGITIPRAQLELRAVRSPRSPPAPDRR